MRKPTVWALTRADTNQPIQSQKQAKRRLNSRFPNDNDGKIPFVIYGFIKYSRVVAISLIVVGLSRVSCVLGCVLREIYGIR